MVLFKPLKSFYKKPLKPLLQSLNCLKKRLFKKAVFPKTHFKTHKLKKLLSLMTILNLLRALRHKRRPLLKREMTKLRSISLRKPTNLIILPQLKSQMRRSLANRMTLLCKLKICYKGEMRCQMQLRKVRLK